MATGGIRTPKTYPQAVVHAVTQAGMLSRAGLTSECKKLGFEKASCLKTALSKCIKEGLVVIDSASYLLADKSELEYAKRLKDALEARYTTHKEKKASRKRADATYRKNLKQAGGLTLKAQADATWAKHGNSSSRFVGEGFFSL